MVYQSYLMRVLVMMLAFLFLVATPANAMIAQDVSDSEQPPANKRDVESLDAIMAAVYDVISGPAGEPRDWKRFESLFAEGARLIPYNANSEAGVQALSPQDYAERAGPFFEQNGFFEAEIGRKILRYGNIAHVFSAYDSRSAATDEEPFARGINSFQLMYHQDRWWVITIYWQGESEDNPIPEDMLN